jgi:hypothetical protein
MLECDPMEEQRYLDEIARRWPETGQEPSKELVDLCQAAAAEHPKSSTLWCDLGTIMQRCGDEHGYTREDYLHCYENAIQCDGMNWQAHEELAYVLDVYFDDFGRAELAFRTAIALGAGADSYCGLARVLAQTGKITEAVSGLSEGTCPFHRHDVTQELRAEILAGVWGRPGDAH